MFALCAALLMILGGCKSTSCCGSCQSGADADKAKWEADAKARATALRDPLEARREWHIARPLEPEAMREAVGAGADTRALIVLPDPYSCDVDATVRGDPLPGLLEALLREAQGQLRGVSGQPRLAQFRVDRDPAHFTAPGDRL